MICSLLREIADDLSPAMMTLFSQLYRIARLIRAKLYEAGILRTKRLPCPVICVGNITTGGTGKTPTVIAIARLLQGGQISNLSPQRSQRIAILTRGYKRKSTEPVLAVNDGNEILSAPQDAGDEPYLIASALKGIPVIVGKDRYCSGQYAIERFGANLFILDDGYQHIRLHRDLNILLIDATNPSGNGHLLPKGVLREPLSAIGRADCMIISRANEGDAAGVERLIRSYNRESPVFYAYYRPVDLVDLRGHTLGLPYIRGKTLLLFSGIANPHSFRNSIANLGGVIKGELIFPDHHWYTDRDIEKVRNEAKRLSTDAVRTTEKDAVRLTDIHTLTDIKNKLDILALQVEMEIDKGFGEWLFERSGLRGAGGKEE